MDATPLDSPTTTVTVEVINWYDRERAARNEIAVDAVRSVTIEALLKPSATHFGLPRDVVERLGLPKVDDVFVRTPSGIVPAGLHSADVRFEDRTWMVSCVALPVGTVPVLGRIPMAVLGIEVDPADGSVRVLDKDSYVRI